MGKYDDVVNSEIASIKKEAGTPGTKAGALKKARELDASAGVAHVFGNQVSLEITRQAKATRRDLEAIGKAKAKALGLTQK